MYKKTLLQTKVVLEMTEIGHNLQQALTAKIERKVGGVCIVEGYIQPKSVHVVSHSSGNVLGELIEFYVAYEANVCAPVEDMELECICKTITKAGVHAEVVDEHGNVPVTVFVAREFQDTHFAQHNTLKEGDSLTVSVIGTRFELHDDCVCVIASILPPASLAKAP